MGLRQDIQAEVAEAFDGDLADAVRSFTGTREVVGEYDPTAGSSVTQVTYSGRGVFGAFEQGEVDGEHINLTDVKLTALQNEVLLDSDSSEATPATGDHIDGKKVIVVNQDPAGATWTLGLRET